MFDHIGKTGYKINRLSNLYYSKYHNFDISFFYPYIKEQLEKLNLIDNMSIFNDSFRIEICNHIYGVKNNPYICIDFRCEKIISNLHINKDIKMEKLLIYLNSNSEKIFKISKIISNVQLNINNMDKIMLNYFKNIKIKDAILFRNFEYEVIYVDDFNIVLKHNKDIRNFRNLDIVKGFLNGTFGISNQTIRRIKLTHFQ